MRVTPLLLVVLCCACGSEVSPSDAPPVATFEVSSASSSASGSGGSGTERSILGLPCEQDHDCGADHTCLRATDSIIDGGGPAGGYCSRPCEAQADCAPEGVCRTLDRGVGMCFLACAAGKPPATLVDQDLLPGKCHARDDVACSHEQGGVCLPICGSDFQCPAPRACDLRFGVCVDSPHDGLPNGEICFGSPDPCAAHCQKFAAGGSVCAQRCTIGGGNFSTHECGGPELGWCSILTPITGVGDVGHCTTPCTKHADCQPPVSWCRDGFQPTLGYCVSAAKCPTGTCGGDEECVETEWGPYCMDPAFAP